MSMIIENFSDNRQNYGKKGNNLKILMNLFNDSSNVFVPETLILPNSLFKKIIDENGNIDLSNFENIFINPQLEKEILCSIHEGRRKYCGFSKYHGSAQSIDGI